MRDESYVERYGYGNTGMVANIHDRVLGFSALESDGVAKGVVEVTGAKISLQDLMALSRTDGSEQACIAIPEDVMLRLENSRAVIDGIVDAGAPVYGINTGFGLMSHTNIDKPDLALLQRNLITSHASGVGTPLDPNIVRRIMALRINTLCRGHSGVSLGTFNTLVKVFNAGLTPEVPCQGTVGASGDLAPLAHIALGFWVYGRYSFRFRQATRPFLTNSGPLPRP